MTLEESSPLPPLPQWGYHELWAVGVLFFGIGDVVTTYIGLGLDGVSEQHPIGVLLLDQYGLIAMVGLKLLAFCGFFVLWRYARRPYSLGVPLGLALLGAAITAWNLHIIW